LVEVVCFGSLFAMSLIPTPAPLPISEVYIDESSTRHRYLVLGAVVIPSANVNQLVGLLREARLPELPQGEMKWTKVSQTKLDAYLRFVDVFFAQPRGTLDFHSAIIDTSKQRHQLYNQGSREIGFNKEMYQLALKCGRLYDTLFHVYPDRRVTDQKPDDLRLMLNRGLRLKGDKRDWPYRRLQFRDSKKTMLIQLTDILAGAVAFHLNGYRHAHQASPAKVRLSDHILLSAGVFDVFRDTAVTGKFTVWHRHLI
jgi:hypothetical protein